MIDLVKYNMDRAKERMKAQANANRKDIEFSEWDWIFVKLKPYRKISIAHRLHHKLSPRFFGPYKIQQMISSVAYKVLLPYNILIHDVFHIFMLKKYKREVPPKEIDPLPKISVGSEPVIYLKGVVDRRTLLGKGKYTEQALVSWFSLNEDGKTWD